MSFRFDSAQEVLDFAEKLKQAKMVADAEESKPRKLQPRHNDTTNQVAAAAKNMKVFAFVHLIIH
jgi:hypothetical protein